MNPGLRARRPSGSARPRGDLLSKIARLSPSTKDNSSLIPQSDRTVAGCRTIAATPKLVCTLPSRRDGIGDRRGAGAVGTGIIVACGLCRLRSEQPQIRVPGRYASGNIRARPKIDLLARSEPEGQKRTLTETLVIVRRDLRSSPEQAHVMAFSSVSSSGACVSYCSRAKRTFRPSVLSARARGAFSSFCARVRLFRFKTLPSGNDPCFWP